MLLRESMLCTWLYRLAVPAALVISATGCTDQPLTEGSADDVSSTELGSSSQNLWALRGSLWNPASVLVCWEPTGNTLAGNDLTTARAVIKRAAEQTWQKESRVTFIGWGDCQANAPGIHIVINGGHPHTKGVGNQLNTVKDGLVMNAFTPLATFADGTRGCGTGAFGENLVGTRDECLFWTSAHEFGHAIGFPHEHNRTKPAGDTCTFSDPGDIKGDWEVTAYDTNSIMNYCNPLWNGHGVLTAQDIAGVRKAYGWPPAATAANAHVALVRQNTTNTTAVSVGNDGALYVRWVYRNETWSPGVAISNGNFAPVGAPVAFGFQGSDQLDAFVVGNDGRLYVAAATNGGPWVFPVAITPANFAPKGARIAVGTQGSNQLDVFVVDANGAIQMLSVVGKGVWSAPRAITANNVAPPGAPLATGVQGTDQLDVFYAANDGAIKAMAVTGTSSTWFGPYVLSATNLFTPGAYLATGKQSGVQLDVFAAGKDGAVKAVWVVGKGTWSGPVSLTGANHLPSGGALTAAQYGSNQLDVFYSDSTGRIRALWVVGQGSFNGPMNLSPVGTAQAGAKMAAATQFTVDGQFQLDLVTAGTGGSLLLQSGTGANPWTTPVTIR